MAEPRISLLIRDRARGIGDRRPARPPAAFAVSAGRGYSGVPVKCGAKEYVLGSVEVTLEATESSLESTKKKVQTSAPLKATKSKAKK